MKTRKALDKLRAEAKAKWDVSNESNESVNYAEYIKARDAFYDYCEANPTSLELKARNRRDWSRKIGLA